MAARAGAGAFRQSNNDEINRRNQETLRRRQVTNHLNHVTEGIAAGAMGLIVAGTASLSHSYFPIATTVVGGGLGALCGISLVYNVAMATLHMIKK